ncbi:hypothetical protein MATL_G00092890 [Megalops atlanticus]|uniref:Uncharacterized protein n=1 Tax=Megalops atlanticus TaxID=7932 RepID=A0A9D3TBN6_MEGAT|nr:hypothetical protein MATL_G00092890 [Megalops atlanticus]
MSIHSRPWHLHCGSLLTGPPDSSTVPPKKLGASRDALFHVLTSKDPEGYLCQQPLLCPVLLVTEENCMIAIGCTPVTTFDSGRLHEGLLYLMAYYYALHLTYPKCISTLLSVLQTEILQDSIHDQDATPIYKKSSCRVEVFH